MDRKDLMFQLERNFIDVFRKMKHDISNIFAHEEVSRNEYFILKILRDKGSLRASDIAKEFNVSASHITVLSDHLVKKGFVLRKRSEIDRRVVELNLLNTGGNLVEELEKKKSAYLHEQFSNLKTEEMAILISLFEKLK